MNSIYALTLQQTAEKAAEKKTKEIAFRMKENGISAADIAKMTNCSIKTLEKWFTETPAPQSNQTDSSQ